MTRSRKKTIIPIPEHNHLTGIDPIIPGDEEKIFEHLTNLKKSGENAILKQEALKSLNLSSASFENMERLFEGLGTIARYGIITEVNLNHSKFNNKDVGDVVEMLSLLGSNKNLVKINLADISFRRPFTPAAFKQALNELDQAAQSDLRNALNNNILQINRELKPALIQLGTTPVASPFLPDIRAPQKNRKPSQRSRDFSSLDKKGGPKSDELSQQLYGRSSAQSMSGSYNTLYTEVVDLSNGYMISLADLRLFNKVVTDVFNNPGDPAQKRQATILERIEELNVSGLTEHLDENNSEEEKLEIASLIRNIVEKNSFLKRIFLNDNKFAPEHLKIIINGLMNAKSTPGTQLTTINLENSIPKEKVSEVSKELKELKGIYEVRLDVDTTKQLNPKTAKLAPLSTSSASLFKHSASDIPAAKNSRTVLPPIKPPKK